MVFADFLTETRRRWLKAFKLFKKNNSKPCRNRISPALVRSPSYNGTVDASSEIDLQRFYGCRVSAPPLHVPNNEAYENTSYYSGYNSFDSSRNESLKSYEGNDRGCETAQSDSAYDSSRSSPAYPPPVCYVTDTYFNVADSDDSSSIKTEYTLLDYDGELDPGEEQHEATQNMINETIELVSSL